MTTSDRVLNILNLFTIENPEWTVEAAAQRLDLAISTAYRYFKSLSNSGLIVAFNPGRYVLGPAIIQYDRQIRLRDPLLTTANGPMQAIAQWLPKQSIVLACGLYRTQVMCVHQISSDKCDFAIAYERGQLMPIYRGPPGLIVLAEMPTRSARQLHGRYEEEMAACGLGKNWEEVRRALRAIRAARVVSRSGELGRGLTCTSVGMRGQDGSVVGSLSTVIPTRTHNKLDFDALTQGLLRAAQTIHDGIALLAANERAAEALRRNGASA